MGINITHTMNSFQQFENRENLRNAAKNILNKQNASQETVQKIVDKTVFEYNPQLSIIKASSQISVNNSLKETLKYLKSHAAKKPAKEPVLGELWNIAQAKDDNSENELYDFEIDNSVENIFAA
ncbi:MAG: hypothetical protein NC408_05935 [Candidatus Gastranaerophilales bacterium]|nr:hypothetical protein [Candidatus Gastranaerophilales bacterium]MCM1072412.1 hypothetical protein [Bacteroides sp.]